MMVYVYRSLTLHTFVQQKPQHLHGVIGKEELDKIWRHAWLGTDDGSSRHWSGPTLQLPHTGTAAHQTTAHIDVCVYKNDYHVT